MTSTNLPDLKELLACDDMVKQVVLPDGSTFRMIKTHPFGVAILIGETGHWYFLATVDRAEAETLAAALKAGDITELEIYPREARS